MRVLFDKINDRYAMEYQLGTEIISDGGKKVRKYPVNETAEAHLDNIFDGYEILKGVYGGTVLCPVHKGDRELVFDFVDGVNGATRLMEKAARKDREGFLACVKGMMELLPEADKEFVGTEAFETVFGKETIPEGIPAVEPVAFDFTPDNLIFGAEKTYFIDYEWFLEFPVPLDLIKTHFIECLYSNHYELESFVPKKDIYEAAGVAYPEEMINCRKNFIKRICGENSLIEIYRRYAKPVFSLGLGPALNPEAESAEENSGGDNASALIGQLNQVIRDQQVKLKGKEEQEAWIRQLEDMVQYQNVKLKEKETQEKWIHELEDMVRLQQEQLKGKEEQEAWIHRLEEMVEFQKEQLADKERQEQWIRECENMIAYQKEKIKLQDEAISQKDEWISTQEQEIYNRGLQLEQASEERTGLEEKLEKSQNEVRDLHQRLFNIENSKFWQRTKRFHKGL